MELPINKITIVKASFKFKPAVSRFLTFHEVTRVFYLAEVPAFCTKPVLLIVKPLTLVHAAISVHEYSEPVGLAVFPLSLVDIAIYMSHSALAIIHFILCLTLVHRSITEFDCAEALPNFRIILAPLSFIFLSYYASVSRQCRIIDLFEVVEPKERFAT